MSLHPTTGEVGVSGAADREQGRPRWSEPPVAGSRGRGAARARTGGFAAAFLPRQPGGDPAAEAPAQP